MPETDWRKVVAQLRELAARPTVEQLRLARTLDLPVNEETPRPVAAALLRRHLREALELPSPDPVTDGALGYLEDLAGQTSSKVPSRINDSEEVDAWVEVLHARRAANFLEALKPVPGDIVQVEVKGGERLGEVASISADGQLNFRGGYGYRARPHRVEMVARVSQIDLYKGAHYKARQHAAARITNPQMIGPGQLTELEKWQVSSDPSKTARLALIDALEAAQDERPMQLVLERHPEILAYLVTGHGGAYVVPQVSFHKYVADFLVAGYTSAGIQWTLVELERPNANLAINDGQPAKEVRRAQQQIADWRDWLTDNLDYARRPVRENGLGLAGIRPDARGLIIVGRGQISETLDLSRRRIEREQRVVVRTYDWLVRQSGHSRSLPFGMLDSELPDAVDDEGW
jgi:antiviral defense system Shedu protein SduA